MALRVVGIEGKISEKPEKMTQILRKSPNCMRKQVQNRDNNAVLFAKNDVVTINFSYSVLINCCTILYQA